jgi:hypothetical protein
VGHGCARGGWGAGGGCLQAGGGFPGRAPTYPLSEKEKEGGGGGAVLLWAGAQCYACRRGCIPRKSAASAAPRLRTPHRSRAGATAAATQPAASGRMSASVRQAPHRRPARGRPPPIRPAPHRPWAIRAAALDAAPTRRHGADAGSSEGRICPVRAARARSGRAPDRYSAPIRPRQGMLWSALWPRAGSVWRARMGAPPSTPRARLSSKPPERGGSAPLPPACAGRSVRGTCVHAYTWGSSSQFIDQPRSVSA